MAEAKPAASRGGASGEEALSLERIFQALGDPVRLGIVRQLAREGESSCAALEGGRAKSTMSHHFRILREAGLVETRPMGVTHMNRLCTERVEAAFPGLLGAILAAAGKPARQQAGKQASPSFS